VIAEISPDGFAAPISHGVQFDDLAARGFIEHVHFENANCSRVSDCWRRKPVIQQLSSASLSRNGSTFRRVQQRSGLCFHSFRSIDVGLLLDREVRFERFDADAKKVLQPLFERDRLRKEQTGIQGENWKVQWFSRAR